MTTDLISNGAVRKNLATDWLFLVLHHNRLLSQKYASSWTALLQHVAQVIQLFTWVEFNGQLFVTHLTDTRFTNWKIFINKKDVVVKYSWRLTKSAWSNPWKYLLRPRYIITYEKDLLEVIKRSYCSLHQPPPPTPPQYSLTWQLVNRGRRNTLMAGVQPSTVTTSYNSYS